MTLTELKSFLAISSLLSFSKAAQSLNYAHSSVTTHIKSLEASLGTELFVRNRKGVIITEAGRRFHEYARQIVDLSRDGEEAVRQTPEIAGRITIGAVETTSTYRLPALLRKVQNEAPDIHITFKIMDSKQLLESIKRGTLDLVFLVEQELVMANTEVVKICNETVSLYVEPGHPLIGVKVKTSELSNYNHLMRGPDCCYNYALIKKLQKSGIQSIDTMEFENTETIKQCALSGLGIAMLTDITAKREFEEGKLVKLNWDLEQEFYSFMLWNKYRSDYPALKFFVECSKKYFSL